MRYLFIVLLVFSSAVQAIVNIEKIELNDEDDPFQGFVDISFSGDSGNTDKEVTSLGSRLQWNNLGSTQFIVLDYEYGKSAGVIDTDKTFLHYRFIAMSQRTYTWEAFAQLETNEFTHLKLRSLAGGGLRWSMLDNLDRNEARLGVGAFYSKEQSNTMPEVIEEQVRANIYFTYKHNIDKRFHFLTTTYYQPDIDNTSDYRALEQLVLEFDLLEKLRFYMSLDISHDNQPPIGVEKTDTSYKSGFKYVF